jgi:Leucine-rich repeat (LRR) protein
MRIITIVIICLVLNSCSQKQSVNQVRVDLSGKHLKEIPDSVFQNNEITYLDLGSSEVTFYPPLSALIDHNSNSISFLPEKIGRLTALKTLILNTNQLTTLPNSITKLIHLEVLDLSINKDLEIVKQLNKLKQLPKLKILKIVDIKMSKDEVTRVKMSLRPDIKIVTTIPEYMELAK